MVAGHDPLTGRLVTTKNVLLQLRISEDDKERLQRAADAEHLALSAWVRQVLLRAADEVETRSATDTHPRTAARKTPRSATRRAP